MFHFDPQGESPWNDLATDSSPGTYHAVRIFDLLAFLPHGNGDCEVPALGPSILLMGCLRLRALEVVHFSDLDDAPEGLSQQLTRTQNILRGITPTQLYTRAVR